MLDILTSNSGLASLLAFALVLIPAVIIHELGHFLAAKSVGITILEFGIGFPPRIGRLFVWRGTEFTLNLLPLGGFVRPLGEDIVSPKGDEHELSDKQEAIERGIEDIKTVNEATPLQRIWFMSAGALFNLITAFLLFIVIGMIGVPEFLGGRVNVVYVEPDSPLAEAGLQTNDAIETIDGDVFGSSLDFLRRLDAVPEGEEIAITVRRGETSDLVELNYTGIAPVDAEDISSSVRVMALVEGAPADEAGMLPGDLITRFNDEPVTDVTQLQQITRENAGTVVDLRLFRAGEVVDVSLTPREDPPPGEGSIGIEISTAGENAGFGLFFQEGIPQQTVVQLSFGEAVRFSVASFTGLIQAIVEVPSGIIRGTIDRQAARPVSIVGISQAGGLFLQQSIEQDEPILILNFIAVISIALGLTNLLPLPALDGGRIMFVLLEIVRGRPIAPEREGLVHLLGLAFLLSLTVIFVINDFLNPITNLLR